MALSNLIAIGTADTAIVDFSGPCTIHLFSANKTVASDGARVSLYKKNSDGSYTLIASLSGANASDNGTIPAGSYAVQRTAGASVGVDREG